MQIDLFSRWRTGGVGQQNSLRTLAAEPFVQFLVRTDCYNIIYDKDHTDRAALTPADFYWEVSCVNLKKSAPGAGLATLVLSCPATAWAASASSSDGVPDILIAIIAVAFLLGLSSLLVKFKRNQLRSGVERLKARDRGFDEQTFKNKVAELFFKTKHAWINRDMEPVRASMSSGLFSRFASQVEKRIRDHTFPRLDELSLDQAEIAAISATAGHDYIAVWIKATAKDYTVDEKGHKVSGSSKRETKDEKWDFARPLNATTSREQDDFNWLLVAISEIEDTTVDD